MTRTSDRIKRDINRASDDQKRAMRDGQKAKTPQQVRDADAALSKASNRLGNLRRELVNAQNADANERAAEEK